MTPSAALRELLARVGAAPGRMVSLSADELAGWPADAVAAFKAHGVLLPGKPGDTAVCPGCERACVMPVQQGLRAGRPAAPFIVCDRRDDVGRVPLAPTHLERWRADAQTLGDALARLLGEVSCQPVPGAAGLFRLGLVQGLADEAEVRLRFDEQGGALIEVAWHALNLATVLTVRDGRLELDTGRLGRCVDARVVGATQVLDGGRTAAPVDAVPGGPYIPFPRALKLLRARLGASAEEVAAWVFRGARLGGLHAFLHANELDPPPRFGFPTLGEGQVTGDYMGLLMGTWYSLPELEGFQPRDRFVTGRVLLEKWSAQPGLSARGFILAKVRESRLRELHPTAGLTQASIEDSSIPEMEEALFFASDIKALEREDFGLDPGAVAAGSTAAPSRAAARAPVWAPEWDSLSPDQKARRIQQRKQELVRERVTAWRKQIAAELDVSSRRVGQYLTRLKKADPFSMMRADLPQTFVDEPGKRKR